MPEMTIALLIDDLFIRNGRLGFGTPIYQAFPTINIACIVKLNKGVEHGLVVVIIHGEAFPLPITGGTQLFELFNDNTTIFLFPFPGMFKKSIPAYLMLCDTLLTEHVDDLGFRGNRGVIRSWNPACFSTLHTTPADKNILHGIIEDVSQG